jgi:hypothetical protein
MLEGKLTNHPWNKLIRGGRTKAGIYPAHPILTDEKAPFDKFGSMTWKHRGVSP